MRQEGEGAGMVRVSEWLGRMCRRRCLECGRRLFFLGGPLADRACRCWASGFRRDGDGETVCPDGCLLVAEGREE